MAKRILLSFLGTGPIDNELRKTRAYKPANYKISNRVYEDKNFIADALIEHYNPDKTVIFGSVKSMWEELYLNQSKQIDENYWEYLFSQVEKLGKDSPCESINLTQLNKELGPKLKGRLIHYGYTEKQIWNNFKIISDELSRFKEESEIYFDITHSFRSIPIFALMSIIYSNLAIGKNFSIKGVFYGMLEMSKEMVTDDGKEICPVVDLSSLVKMQDWVMSVNNFKTSGNGKELANLLAKERQDTGTVMANLSNSISLNFTQAAEDAMDKFLQYENHKFSDPAKMAITPIMNKVKELKRAESHAEFQLNMAEWHASNMNYGNAYITLIEAMIRHGADKQPDGFSLNTESNQEIAKNYWMNNAERSKLWNNVNKHRKRTSHPNMRTSTSDVKQAIENLPILLEQVKSEIKPN